MLGSLLTKLLASPTLRGKLIFTAAIFLVYRLFAHVPVAGVDVEIINQLFTSNQFLSFLNVFAGGTLANFSVMAVGISPYITASIIMQLMTMVFPKLKEIQKEGESGKEKINMYTRFMTAPIGVVQSVSVLALLNTQGLLIVSEPITVVAMVTSMTAGGMIVMWLGELVTKHGLGNGISMILLAGILSMMPSVMPTILAMANQMPLLLAGFLVSGGAVMVLIVFMNEAIRKVTIEYAKRQRGSRIYGGNTTHLPIKINVAGVMPIIFGVSIMLAPSFAGGLLIGSANPQLSQFGSQISAWFSQTSPIYMLTYFVVVFAFSFFSAMIFFNTEDISDELKKSGAFLPGIRPGGPTKNFLDFVVTRITLVGAVFLGVVAVLPSIAQAITNVPSLAIGGTSLLIVVSVILDTTKQVEGQTVSQNYDQFLSPSSRS